MNKTSIFFFLIVILIGCSNNKFKVIEGKYQAPVQNSKYIETSTITIKHVSEDLFDVDIVNERISKKTGEAVSPERLSEQFIYTNKNRTLSVDTGLGNIYLKFSKDFSTFEITGVGNGSYETFKKMKK